MEQGKEEKEEREVLKGDKEEEKGGKGKLEIAIWGKE